MPEPVKFLTFAGSTRKGSINKQLARLGAKLINEDKLDATYIDLADFTLPLYDGDFEANNPYPENALKLKNLLRSHDGFLIASPEYNSSMTAVLKNTLDWISRSEDKKVDLSSYSGKVVAITSAAPGQLGGLRGLTHLREILTNLGCFVIPNQLAVPGSFSAFDDDGNLVDAQRTSQLKGVLHALTQTTKRFKVDLEQYCNQIFGDYCAQQMGDEP